MVQTTNLFRTPFKSFDSRPWLQRVDGNSSALAVHDRQLTVVIDSALARLQNGVAKSNILF